MDLDINFVSRTDISTTKRRSKYGPLIEALQKIKEGGRAVKVSFGNRSELNTIRNVVYRYNRKKGASIKSRKHPTKKEVFFFK